jgi:hypothetical protein
MTDVTEKDSSTAKLPSYDEAVGLPEGWRLTQVSLPSLDFSAFFLSVFKRHPKTKQGRPCYVCDQLKQTTWDRPDESQAISTSSLPSQEGGLPSYQEARRTLQSLENSSANEEGEENSSNRPERESISESECALLKHRFEEVVLWPECLYNVLQCDSVMATCCNGAPPGGLSRPPVGLALFELFILMTTGIICTPIITGNSYMVGYHIFRATAAFGFGIIGQLIGTNMRVSTVYSVRVEPGVANGILDVLVFEGLWVAFEVWTVWAINSWMWNVCLFTIVQLFASAGLVNLYLICNEIRQQGYKK